MHSIYKRNLDNKKLKKEQREYNFTYGEYYYLIILYKEI